MRRPEFAPALLLCALLGFSEGCSEENDSQMTPVEMAERPGDVGRVVIFAVDGAAASVVDELFAQGRLPHFKNLVDRGCYGSLKTHPSSNSCLIWTSIATGVTAEQHGIDDFVYRDDGGLRLFTSGMVRFPRLWELASRREITVGVTNYWVTYPVAPVNGFVISDHAIPGKSNTYTRYFTKGQQEAPARIAADLFYPSDLQYRLDPILGNRLQANGALEPTDFETYHSAFAVDAEVFALENEASSLRKPRLSVLYAAGIDLVSHHFWGFYKPDSRAYEGHPRPSERDLATFRHVVPSKYEHTDALIGEVIADLDANDVVIVVSDHGFSGRVRKKLEGWERGFNRGDHGDPNGEPPSVDGIYIISGGPVTRGSCPGQLTMYDIAPTSLYLLDVPVPDHMVGRVATELFADSFVRRRPIRRADAAQPGVVRPRAKRGPAEREVVERLRALGYIE
jgi:hypothetical protein